MLVPILSLCLATYVNAKLCENNQFWSSILEKCENCSKCVYPDITIRPCQGYADSVCGPLSELNIDWTWLKNQGSHPVGKRRNIQKEMLDTFKENFDEIRQHELHKKEKQRYLRRKHNKHADDGSDEIEGGDIFVGDHYQLGKNGKMMKNLRDSFKISSKHRALGENIMDDGERKKYKSRNHFDEPEMTLKTWQKLFRAHSEGLHFNNVEAFELLKNTRASDKEENETYDPNNLKFDENGILIKNFGFEKVEDNVKMEKLIDESKLSEDFTTTEKFILDWQTVILGIAVSSCIVFFLVAAIYSVQHAKHWKKLRNYFDADVEELQSWISSKNTVSKIPSSGIYKTTTEVVHTEGSQCKYLERIIRMNGKKKFNFVTGNVYEKDNKRPAELKPLTKKYPLVHKKSGTDI